MNYFRQGLGWLVSFAVAAILASSAYGATNSIAHFKPASVPAAIMPPPSPMDYFRNLLAMSPLQREKILANKSPQIRVRILAKVNEYAALNPDERELRLRATELRFFLMPLLRAAPDARSTRLALVPANVRDLVQSRLMQWEILPPNLQQEFLENEHAMTYFSSVNATNVIKAGDGPSDAEESHWNALPENERQNMTAEFKQFFELSPQEKQKTLGALSDAERKQMEKTLQMFDKLPPLQKAQCMRAYDKFANLSRQEQAEFLINARHWAAMSVAERKAWSDLVTHVPQWPPLSPAAIMPPLPTVPKNFHPAIATNQG
jgi:hypothetical protein